MERWLGKIALVTGASSGIGESITEELVKAGLIVVGIARRVERIEVLKQKLLSERGDLHPFKCDLSKNEDIDAVFQFIEEKFGTIHVLVNNAGLCRSGLICDSNSTTFQKIVDVNLTSVAVCINKAITLMRKYGVNDGHIVNMNSVTGHKCALQPVVPTNVYAATKFGLTGLTETVRLELASLKIAIRITSISPGVVATRLTQATGPKSVDPRHCFDEMPALRPKDIADSVLYAISAPAHVTIGEIIIRPTGETL